MENKKKNVNKDELTEKDLKKVTGGFDEFWLRCDKCNRIRIVETPKEAYSKPKCPYCADGVLQFFKINSIPCED